MEIVMSQQQVTLNTIYTIGHSRHPLERFVELLRQHQIEVLVDVRSVPYSKHAPQYRKHELEQAVEAQGVTYLHLGEELGGMPRASEPEFRAGLTRLMGLAEENHVVIMCAEEDPARCHRSALIAPALRERGVAVVHIRGDGRLQQDDGGEVDAEDGQLSLFGRQE
jgi:uncharacterized protein (DUF488 family)